MTSAKVIVVTLTEPYPFGHALGRWHYVLLKELSRRRFYVRCLSATTNQRWAELASEAMEPLGVHLSLHPISLGPNWLGRKWRTLRRPFSYALTDSLKEAFATEIRAGYDILHLEQLWTGYLAEERPRTLVAVHHLIALDLNELKFPRSLRFLLQRHLMRRTEKRLLRRLDVISTLSKRLVTSIQSINPVARVFIVPFGLDPSLYPFTVNDRSGEPVIGFVGSMVWMPGYLAAHRLITRIFPLVKKRVPNARLLIAGWHAREALADFVNHPDVILAENVPDSQSYFERLQVLAYPLPQGSGVKVKILEALALGIPVVTTTDGVEGIEAIDGEHCFVADEDHDFAERVVELLLNASLRRSFRRRGRALVEEQHSPVPVVNRLVQVYEAL